MIDYTTFIIDNVQTPSLIAQNSGIRTYAVGVGEAALKIELEQIASQPLDRHMFQV